MDVHLSIGKARFYFKYYKSHTFNKLSESQKEELFGPSKSLKGKGDKIRVKFIKNDQLLSQSTASKMVAKEL